MPDFSDELFDNQIRRALDSPVSAMQKRRAWEQARARAAQQPMLPPTQTLRQRISAACQTIQRGLVWLCVEEDPYAHAWRQQHTLPQPPMRGAMKYSIFNFIV